MKNSYSSKFKMAKRFKMIELFESLKMLGKYDAKAGKFNKSFKFYIASYFFLFINCIFILKEVFFHIKLNNPDKIMIVLIGDMYAIT